MKPIKHLSLLVTELTQLSVTFTHSHEEAGEAVVGGLRRSCSKTAAG